jgi:glycosyltransferase involved in cell wall biosynthesis
MRGRSDGADQRELGMEALSIVFCTRNRPDDLRRAIASALACRKEVAGMPLEILVIDDGVLDSAHLEAITAQVREANASFAYVNKRERAGLMHSRIEAVARAGYQTMLFLDDDVELESGYLGVLAATYAAHPHIRGVGGVDLLCRLPSTWRQIYEYLIGFRSWHLGRLSVSGFGGGVDRWKAVKKPFVTQFLIGCNMSFRRSALANLVEQSWLNGYSLGEDIYLSWFARRRGPLLVNPRLQVRHYHSPLARDRLEQVTYTQIVNHYHLLRTQGARAHNYAALLITAAGFLLMFATKAALDLTCSRAAPDLSRVRGSARGIKFVVGSLVPCAPWTSR